MRSAFGSQCRPRADPPCGHAPGPPANRVRVDIEKQSRIRGFPRLFCKPASFFKCSPKSVCRNPRPRLLGPARVSVFYGKWRFPSASASRRATAPGETPAQALDASEDTPHFPEEPPFPVKTAAPTRSARLSGKQGRRRRSGPTRGRSPSTQVDQNKTRPAPRGEPADVEQVACAKARARLASQGCLKEEAIDLVVMADD